MGHVAQTRVYKRKDSPYYVLAFYDEEGNRIRRTSRATSRKAALVELNHEIARAAVPVPTSLPIASGFKLFLDTRPLKESSRGRYETTLRHWVTYFKENSITDFGQIRKRILSAFIAWRRQAGVLDPTIRRDLAFLSAVWNFLADHPEWDEDMPPCPVTRGLLKNVRPSRMRVRYASTAEWQALMDSSNQPYQRHILTLAVETGMREGELTQLTWDMVDLPKRQIVLTPDVVSLKNDTPRIIPLSRVACDTLTVTVRHAKSRFVFWHDGGQPFVKFSNFWKGVRQRSGVQNFKFHDIRHTFASSFLNNGGDLMTLSRILGHSSVQVTERYAHLLTSTIHKQMELVDARKATAFDNLGELDSV